MRRINVTAITDMLQIITFCELATLNFNHSILLASSTNTSHHNLPLSRLEGLGLRTTFPANWYLIISFNIDFLI